MMYYFSLTLGPFMYLATVFHCSVSLIVPLTIPAFQKGYDAITFLSRKLSLKSSVVSKQKTNTDTSCTLSDTKKMKKYL